ncbi:MAG: hypothetical protein R2851_18590 [Caldilineaceae bacterium]
MGTNLAMDAVTMSTASGSGKTRPAVSCVADGRPGEQMIGAWCRAGEKTACRVPGPPGPASSTTPLWAWPGMKGQPGVPWSPASERSSVPGLMHE